MKKQIQKWQPVMTLWKLNRISDNPCENLIRDIFDWPISLYKGRLDIKKVQELFKQPLEKRVLKREFTQRLKDHIVARTSRPLNEEECKEIEGKLKSWLKPRELKVLELRYGLYGNKPHTLNAVGKIFGVKGERIRQIQAKALQKLRHPVRKKYLVRFYSWPLYANALREELIAAKETIDCYAAK